MLPAAVRVFYPHNCSRSRLEVLLELRNEVAYLGLMDLVELCTAELAFVGTASSMLPTPDLERTSLHSTHTLCEPSDDDGSAVVGKKDGSASSSRSLHRRSPPPSSHLISTCGTRSASARGAGSGNCAWGSEHANARRSAHRLRCMLDDRTRARRNTMTGVTAIASPASSPGPITPLARADSLYYSRKRKVALPWSWQAGRPPQSRRCRQLGITSSGTDTRQHLIRHSYLFNRLTCHWEHRRNI